MSISKTCSVVPPHCHHEKLSSGSPWLPYTIQLTLGYNISFTWSGRCYKYSGSWDSPECTRSLLSVWQVLKKDTSQGHVKTNIITVLYLQHCTSLATVTLQDSKLVLLVLSFEDSFGTCMDTKSWLLQIEVQCHCEQRSYPHVYHDLPVALGHPLECIEWEINIHIFQYLSEVVLNQ